MAWIKDLTHRIDGKDANDRARLTGYDCRAYLDDGTITSGLAENIAKRHRVSRWVGRPGYWRPKEYEKDAKAMARGLVNQWMDSPGHRRNILEERYQRIGVGVAVSEGIKAGYVPYVDEIVYATQNFSSCPLRDE